MLLDPSRRPSGLKHTDHTETPCPLSVLTHAPVSTSHSRTVRSLLLDASRRPSGLKHTDLTHSPYACPSWLYEPRVRPVASRYRR